MARFINDSYACIKEKGTHRAMYKVEDYYNYMKRMYGDFYILKCYYFNDSVLVIIVSKKE